MSFIDWSPDFSVNHDDLDNEHREFIDAVNRLRTGLFEHRPKESIHDLFEFLTLYARKHFEDEENLMQEIGYPGYEQHKAAHEELLKAIEAHELHFREGRSRESAELLTFLLKSWLVDHILGMDRQYGYLLGHDAS